MKTTAILTLALGLAGFGAGRWFWPAAHRTGPPAASETAGGNPAKTAAAPVPAEAFSSGPRPSADGVLQATEGEQLILLLRWLPGTTAGEVAEMASNLKERHLLQGGIWTALAARWVEVDPETALEFARTESAETLKHYQRGELRNMSVRIHSLDVYQSLLELNPDQAMASLPLEPSAILNQLLRQLTRSVAKEKREAWAAANASLPESKLWAADPEAEAREKAPKPARRGDLYSLTPEAEAIKALIDAKDLAGSRAKIDAMPPNFQRAMLELDYARALAAWQSPQAAADWASKNLNGLARAQAITLAAQELSKTDPAKALAMLRDHKIPDLGHNLVGVIEVRTQGTSTTGNRRHADLGAMQAVVSAAAKTDPRAAMDYLLTAGGILPRDLQMRYVDNDDTTNNGSLGRSIFRQWAASDPRAAASWLAAQPSTKGLAEMLPLAAGPLGTQTGPESRSFVLDLPQGPVRQGLIGFAAAEWAMAGTDGADALQWAANAGGATGLSAAFQELTQKNAEVASQHFSMLPPETQAERLQSLTDALGQQKPQALPQLYAGLPEDMRSDVNLREALTSLAKLNVEQASGWLNEIPSGKARDTGISGLVDYLIKAPQPDPEAAAHWAAASADPEAQGRRLQRVAEAWQKQDPSGAAAAIRSSNLAEPVRQQLLGFLKSGKTSN